MDTSIPLRIDANARQWSGNNSPQGDRQNRRRQKLQALLVSLKEGDLEASRQAFTVLATFDPSVATDPYLRKVGAALQGNNIYAAQHFGQEIQKRGFKLQPTAPATQIAQKIGDRQLAQDIYSGLKRVDLSA